MSEENKFFSDYDSSENDNESNNDQSKAEDQTDAVEDADTIYFGETPNNTEETISNEFPKKEKRQISIKAFVVSLIAAILVATMLTYTICSAFYRTAYSKAYADAVQNSHINGNIAPSNVDEFDIIAKIIAENSYNETDPDKLMQAAIAAYVAQTGDAYAAYYTQEELDAMQSEDLGQMVGVGINIINTTINYKGSDIKVLKVVNVVKDSPAQEKGVKIGDYIYAAIIDEKILTTDELGYDEILNKLLGKIDTTASFIALREDGEGLKEIRFDIVRKNIISRTVYYRIPNISSNADKKIGVVKITKFDYTTPAQFCEAIEALKKDGCTKFILDVRNNPGGYQTSVAAVLSYFLAEGDVYIRTKDKKGNIKSDTIKVVTQFEGEYEGCNVSKEDIGKYKDLVMTVICNEYTASAGELFVATFKDYKLGKVVGNTTYGKGTMQSTYYLQNYAIYNYGITGIDGAVKLTTHEYFSAKSDSYNGIGIHPDEKVQLSDEAMKYNVYDFEKLDPVDDQLLKAINILNG